MTPKLFLLLNLALAFYNVGTIWAHEVDIFRTWKLLDASDFRRVQQVHWRKLPYWVFAPVGLAFAGSFGLVWYHGDGTSTWPAWCVIGCQLASHVLTAAMWGRWQAKLAADPAGPRSPYLTRILATHWLRTLLITISALVLLGWAADAMAAPATRPTGAADAMATPATLATGAAERGAASRVFGPEQPSGFWRRFTGWHRPRFDQPRGSALRAGRSSSFT